MQNQAIFIKNFVNMLLAMICEKILLTCYGSLEQAFGVGVHII